MKKYAIYSDVDGTIYGHGEDKSIHKQNIEAIDKARSIGIEFVITTGNGLFEVMNNLATRLNASYLITSNGASIYDFKNKKYIFKSTIPFNKVKTLIEVALELECYVAAWNEENFYAVKEKTTKEIKTLFAGAMLGSHKDIRDIKEVNSEILKLEIFDEPNKIDTFIEKVKNLDLQIARMAPGVIEITNAGVSKGEAVKVLNKILEIEANDFMTIGDSANDHSMLAITDLSYAMANADDKTKAIAKLHTSSAEQGGLGEAIDDFLYRKRIDI